MSRLKERWCALVAREREKTKDMTFKKKVQYVAGNWWMEIFGVLVAIGVICALVYFIDSKTNTRLLYLAVTDVVLEEQQSKDNCAAFKEYIGDTKRKHVVMADTNVSTRGAILEEIPEDTDDQQKSMILIGTGLVDAYICREEYVDYLLSYDDLAELDQVLTPEQMAAYGEYAVSDYALCLDGTPAAEQWNVQYAPCYLVFTHNNHFPEVTRAFADFCFGK